MTTTTKSLLPKVMVKAATNFHELIIFIYGPPKIGKSAFANQGKPLFLATEQGLKALDRYETQIDSWRKFKMTCKEISLTKPDYPYIVIDTVDNLWKLCVDYVCAKFDMQHPSDEGYGKGWDLVKDEWRRVITKLSMLGYGLWFISHSQERESKTRTSKLDKIMPTIPNSCRGVTLPMADIIVYLSKREIERDGETVERRVAIFDQTETIEAGDKTGKMPLKMDMGESPEEFYEKFRRRFKKGGKHGRRK